MNVDDKIEQGQGTIYHELGHYFGYCLANKNTLTELGEVEYVEIGFLKNCVVARNSFYHFDDVFNQRPQIKTNTSNIQRTIAWFIEVVAGCTFHSIFESKEFKICFEGHGNIDLMNLSAIRTSSYFIWSFNDIFELQNDFKELMVKYSIVKKTSPIVNEIKLKIRNSTANQLTLINDELCFLHYQIDDIISVDLLTDYLSLINKYYSRFSGGMK